jgi:hypothetical protein
MEIIDEYFSLPLLSPSRAFAWLPLGLRRDIIARRSGIGLGLRDVGARVFG